MFKKKFMLLVLMLSIFIQTNISYASEGLNSEVIVRLTEDNQYGLDSNIYYPGNMINKLQAEIYVGDSTFIVDKDILTYTSKKDFINIIDNKQVDIIQLLNAPGSLYYNSGVLENFHESDIDILRANVVKKLSKLNIIGSVNYINNNLNINEFINESIKHPKLFSTAGKTREENQGNDVFINCSCLDDTDLEQKNSISYNNSNQSIEDFNSDDKGMTPTKLNYPKNKESLSSKQIKIVSESKKYLGTKYVWGGNSLTNGVDCSGFTRELYKLMDINIPRVSRDQAKAGISIDIEDIKTGDLIFFKSSPKDEDIGHVGMYIGNGEFIHASSGAAKVVISSLDNIWYANCFVAVKRFL